MKDEASLKCGHKRSPLGSPNPSHRESTAEGGRGRLQHPIAISQTSWAHQGSEHGQGRQGARGRDGELDISGRCHVSDTVRVEQCRVVGRGRGKRVGRRRMPKCVLTSGGSTKIPESTSLKNVASPTTYRRTIVFSRPADRNCFYHRWCVEGRGSSTGPGLLSLRKSGYRVPVVLEPVPVPHSFRTRTDCCLFFLTARPVTETCSGQRQIQQLEEEARRHAQRRASHHAQGEGFPSFQVNPVRIHVGSLIPAESAWVWSVF